MTTVLKFQPTNAYKDVKFFDIRDQLPVNPHYTWAQLAGVRPITALSTIVVHHDGMSKAQTARYGDVELAKRIATAHINSKKFHPKGSPGFPYDLWIRNGTIYWCNDIEQREYGVGGHNGYTVNICVSGEYAYTDSLTDRDRKALYAAIIMMQDALPEDRYIKGHNELGATSCPGFDMDKVRNDVAELRIQIDYEKSVEHRAIAIQDLYARVNHLYSIYYNNDQYAADAERKLYTLYQLAEQYELMLPTQKGKTIA